ncbi:unnamed protein product [Amoebophrya sp. A120]|nr:unnamed protein product [Amoebophrya sp. A120]|eukprot:GSA120T00019988001.1
MGNWKKRNEAKRQRTLENARLATLDVVEKEKNKAGLSTVESNLSPGAKNGAGGEVNENNVGPHEDQHDRHDLHSRCSDDGGIQFESLALDAALLKTLRTLDRFHCAGCSSRASVFCPKCLTLDSRLYRKMATEVALESAQFPIKLHIITHPGEKLQKSSVAGLKFLCREYYQNGWIQSSDEQMREVDETPVPQAETRKRFSCWDYNMDLRDVVDGSCSKDVRPNIVRADGKKMRKIQTDKLPWITTSLFLTEEELQEGNKTKNESPSMFSSTREFFELVDLDDCVLLFPEDDVGDSAAWDDGISARTFSRNGSFCPGGRGAVRGPDGKEPKSEIVSAQNDRNNSSEAAATEGGGEFSSSSLTSQKPKIAILIDSTWFQTEKILQSLPQGLRKYGLKSHTTRFWRHHGRVQDQGLTEKHLSTVEAAYFCVRQMWLEDEQRLACCEQGTTDEVELDVEGLLVSTENKIEAGETYQKKFVLTSSAAGGDVEKNTLVQGCKKRSSGIRTADEKSSFESSMIGRFDNMLLWFAHQHSVIEQNRIKTRREKAMKQ